jgi:hypothetical protein
MKTFKRIALGLVLLTAILAIATQFLPAQWTVSRSIVINAPGEAILPLVSDLKTGWGQWSTFDQEDPGIIYSYSGPPAGAGAKRSWVSKQMGNGDQTIVKADPKTGVQFQLVMTDYDVHLDGQLSFEPAGQGTKVTWTDQGSLGHSPLQRLMGVMMDSMMGKTFEASLGNLKAVAEKAQAAATQATPPKP